MKKPTITLTLVDRVGSHGCHRGHRVGDTFDYDAGVINASFAFLDAVRHNGIYQGGRLSIEVNPDGSINKICEEPANQTGFCTMAESAGYQRWEGGGGDEPISAGFTVSCDGGVLVNGQCMYY